MHMETLNCGYHITPSPMLGQSPISPPISPTNHGDYSSGCSSHLYAETQYSSPSYSSPQLHRYDDDITNNNNVYDNLKDFSSLSISGTSEDFSLGSGASSESPLDSTCISSPSVAGGSSSSRTRSKKSSRSKVKTSASSLKEEEDHNRKDSFVYDVRLPDEQFLFFVPDLDLVKSHLMFAVREEVDVLKEKIVELMDRINHLECENTVLRQCASPEVLQQLPGQVPHQLQQPPHHSSTS